MARNLESELESLQARLPGEERWKTMQSLRCLEEDWAREALANDALRAMVTSALTRE